MKRPELLSFDIFGTVLDWKRGMSGAVERELTPAEFEAVIDWQGRAEKADPGARYWEITGESLVAVLGLDPKRADEIGRTVGTWPPFVDSVEALRRLMRRAPLVALTNSDRMHGEQAQQQLGRFTHWLCAEELGVYKPAPAVWRAAAEKLGRPLGPRWWHVSAYGDYDLEVARSLGLTAVFVRRPHHRPGPADLTVNDLGELADLVERL